jgi:hypothetical protein
LFKEFIGTTIPSAPSAQPPFMAGGVIRRMVQTATPQRHWLWIFPRRRLCCVCIIQVN